MYLCLSPRQIQNAANVGGSWLNIFLTYRQSLYSQAKELKLRLAASRLEPPEAETCR